MIHGVNIKAGQTVIEEQAASGSLYLVKEGELKVARLVRGKRRELGTFGRGDHFGEVSFIDKKPRSASIVAVKDSALLVLSRKDFETLLRDSPKIQSKLLRALLVDLCEKLRQRNDTLDLDLSDLLPIIVFETDRFGNIAFINRTRMISFPWLRKPESLLRWGRKCSTTPANKSTFGTVNINLLFPYLSA